MNKSFKARMNCKYERLPNVANPYMLQSDKSSKLYPRMRWCVSAAKTVLASDFQAKDWTRTPSQDSKTLPSRSCKLHKTNSVNFIWLYFCTESNYRLDYSRELPISNQFKMLRCETEESTMTPERKGQFFEESWKEWCYQIHRQSKEIACIAQQWHPLPTKFKNHERFFYHFKKLLRIPKESLPMISKHNKRCKSLSKRKKRADNAITYT